MKKRPRDPAQLAKLIVDIATGEVEDCEPEGKEKDPAAVERGRLGGITCKRVQVDEIWSFVGSKQVNTSAEKKASGEAGDCWTWTAIDADTKLMPSWLVSDRSGDAALEFMLDLQGRLANRVQLTSDGHGAYLRAVDESFGTDIDYAMLVKIYGSTSRQEQRCYSPPQCIGATKHAVTGNPDTKHISTSYAERQNLNIRMHTRRFTRLTNAFSKKVENHALSVALFAMYYNFVRIHKTLRITPAMAAGVTAKLWEIGDVVKVLEDWEAAN
jgi:IS1 family transposase